MKVAVEIPEMNDFMEAIFKRLDVLENKLSKLQGEQDGKDFFSVSEVARRLGFSTNKVRHLFYEGKLEGKKDGQGKKIMIARQSVEKYEEGVKTIPLPKFKFA